MVTHNQMCGTPDLELMFVYFFLSKTGSDEPRNVEEHITNLNVEIKNLKLEMEKQVLVKYSLFYIFSQSITLGTYWRRLDYIFQHLIKI